MEIKAFHDEDTSTLSYVVYEPRQRDCVVIDPVLGLDAGTWHVSTAPAEAIRQFVVDQGLVVRWVLDTHAHADHLSGMDTLKRAFDAPTAIGVEITKVQTFFRSVYNLDSLPADGRQWDRLLRDGERFSAGAFEIEVIHTPGHTPACVCYRIGDLLFTGDALFMPDYGTGRCDFPGGSAEQLYDSVTGRLYTLPPEVRVFVGHDYRPGGRALRYETTIGESREHNVQLRAATSRGEFVRFRRERDATLKPPALILQSLQVNIDAGRLPRPESNGRVYFKMPINFLGS
jgi:glyoxylase-like metal-dependent hydrolase (beta-lactamase superfamily II)